MRIIKITDGVSYTPRQKPQEETVNKGNPKIVFRITPLELAQLKQMIADMNRNVTGDMLDVSEFCRRAVREKMAHRERSRTRRKKGLDLS